MPLSEEIIARLQIEELTTDYWYDVDHNWGAGAADFFTEDGVFEVGNNKFEGREAIRTFYSWRENRGARVARHLINNMNLKLHDNNHATAVWIMSLLAADGAPPLPSEPPIMIADVTDECICDSAGRWRYAHRKISRIFVGKTAATVPPDELVRKKS